MPYINLDLSIVSSTIEWTYCFVRNILIINISLPKLKIINDVLAPQWDSMINNNPTFIWLALLLSNQIGVNINIGHFCYAKNAYNDDVAL